MLSDKSVRALRLLARGEQWPISANTLHALEAAGYVRPGDAGAELTSEGLAYLAKVDGQGVASSLPGGEEE